MELKDVLKGKFLILDTETTTKYTNRAEAVELGIINQDGKTVFHSLLKPIFRIDKPAIDVHGIHMGKVKNAPLFVDVYPKLKQILENQHVLIYNASFDNRVLKNSCTFYKIPPIDYSSYCVMRAYKQFTGAKKHVKLEKASGVKTRHRVLEDCRDTLSILNLMKGHKQEVTPIHPNRPSFQASYELFRSGKTIKEIAYERGLAISTVESHLIRSYHEGLDVDLEQFINKKYEEKILNVVESIGIKPLKELKRNMDEQIGYIDIKAVLLKHKNVFIS